MRRGRLQVRRTALVICAGASKTLRQQQPGEKREIRHAFPLQVATNDDIDVVHFTLDVRLANSTVAKRRGEGHTEGRIASSWQEKEPRGASLDDAERYDRTSHYYPRVEKRDGAPIAKKGSRAKEPDKIW
jgi:hypothetical protein